MSKAHGPRTEGDPGVTGATSEPVALSPFAPGGAQLARFGVRARLGRGGTGTVVRAYDRDEGYDVALKTIRRAEGDALLRFKREFRALRGVRHPTLVELYELLEHEGEWFYTMENLEGIPPLEYVRKGAEGGARFDEARLRDLLAQLAGGIHALHRAGLVHRDVKPSNVLVTPEGRVVLLDFGLVASARDGYQSTDVPTAGTVSYMAPEQALGMPAEPASDWYAFGVILFEALTGRAPYEGMTLEIMLAKAQRPPREPRELEPTAPADLNRLCARLLAVDPADRPRGDEILACLGAEGGAGAAHPARDALVGRERELASLHAAAERAFAGEPQMVRIEGEAGVGASALVEAFVGALPPEVVVLRGRCDPRERIPFQGLDGVVDGASSHLRRRGTTHAPLSSAVHRVSRDFPVLRRVPTVRAAPEARPGARDDDRGELPWALRAVLSSLVASSPVVLVLEDVHWLDEASERLLAEVTHPPNAPALLVVTSRRTDGEPGGDVPLLPLTPELAGGLVRRRLGQRADDVDVDAIVASSKGYPSLALALAALAEKRGLRAPTLEDLVAERLDEHGEEARVVLELVAVAGDDLARATLADAGGLSPLEAARCTRALLHTRLLALGRDGGAVRIDHPLLAEAIRACLAPERIAALHLGLADALGRGGRGRSEARVRHLLAGGERGRAATVAAEEADALAHERAFDQAAALYRLALELAPVAEGPDPRLEALGHALSAAGRSEEASAAYLEAASRAAPGVALEHRRRAAEQLAFSGRFEEGRALYAELVRELGGRFPRGGGLAYLFTLTVEALVRLRRLSFDRATAREEPRRELELAVRRSASIALAPVDGRAGLVHVPRALRLAMRLGDPAAVAISVAQTGTAIAFFTGAKAKRTAPLLARASSVASTARDPSVVGSVDAIAGVTLTLHGEWAAAEEAFARASDRLVPGRPEADGLLRTLDAARLQPLFFLGRYDALRGQLDRLTREAELSADRYLPVRLHAVMLPIVACMGDRADEGLDAAEAALRARGDLGLEQRQTYLRTRVLAHAYAGRYAVARELLRTRDGVGRAPYRVQVLRISMRALEALVGLAAAANAKERLEGRRAALRAAQELDREESRWASALALAVRAAASASEGHRETAVAFFESASAVFASVGMKAHALACGRHAGVLDGASETDARIVRAHAFMRSHGIVRADRFASLLVPFEPGLPAGPRGDQ